MQVVTTEEALALRNAGPAIPVGLASSTVECRLRQAYSRLRLGQVRDGNLRLREALVLGRERDLRADGLGLPPDQLAFLCADALEFGIEPDYVRGLIQQAQLRAPSPEWARWPHPVRIYTLGRPSLVVEGRPLRFHGKAQQRPLDVLFLLVASGGRDVPVTRITKLLWPALDGHEARNAFDMALSRLRRLLVVPDALLMSGGRLTLNDRYGWVDLWAFERLLAAVDGAADLAYRVGALRRVFGWYQGEFLSGLDDGWVALARERICSKLNRTILDVSQALEHVGLWNDAAQVLDRAREIFPLEERIWRGLIRCLIAQGEFAQARQRYERCRELFAKVLGAQPSAATRALIEAPDFKRGG